MALAQGLSVKVAASVADFKAGMGSAKDSAQDLSLSLQRLSRSSASAESNLDEVGRSAAGATPGMVAFGAGTQGAGVAVRGLSLSIVATLIPALVTLSATLVPIVAALGGFVAIAGSIGAIGLVGTLGAIAKFGDQLKVVLKRIGSVLMEELAPAFDLAAEVLFILMDEFLQIIPALVPAQDVVQRLAGNFAQLGTEFIKLLPALVDLATTLAVEFLPPFVTWVQDILPQVPGFIQTLVDSFSRVLPKFLKAGELLADLGPALLDFGFTALNVVGPALADITAMGTDALEMFNSLSGNIQGALAKISLLAPIVVGLVSLLGGPLTLALGGVVGAVVGFARAFQTNFANIRTYLTGLQREFSRVFGALKVAFDAFTSGIDFDALTAAVGRYESALSSQLMQTLVDLRPVFDKFIGMLRENKEEFRTIGKFAGDVITTMINLSTVMVNKVIPVMRSILIPVFNSVIDVIGFTIDAFVAVIKAGKNMDGAINALAGSVAVGFGKMLVAGTQWANSFKNLFIDTWNFIISGFGQAFNSILSTITNGINGVISLINSAIAKIPWDKIGLDAPDQLGQISNIQIDTASQRFERAATEQTAVQKQVVEKIATITVENGEIVAKMDERADKQISDRERRSQRLQNRGVRN